MATHHAHLLRCGQNPPTKQEIYHIYKTPTGEKKRSQFCVFFNITSSTLESWQRVVREVLREDSGLTDPGRGTRTVGRQKFVFAQPGARAWWQLEPDKRTDFHIEDRELVLRVWGMEPLMEYFVNVPVSAGQEVDDVDSDGLLVKRYVPSFAMTVSMLRELMRYEAHRMKYDEAVLDE